MARCGIGLVLSHVLCGSKVIAVLDQQPGGSSRVAPVPTSADQDPRAPELLAVESELQIALLQRSRYVLLVRRPSSLIPQHHRTSSVLTCGDHALEARVLDRVILD